MDTEQSSQGSSVPQSGEPPLDISRHQKAEYLGEKMWPGAEATTGGPANRTPDMQAIAPDGEWPSHTSLRVGRVIAQLEVHAETVERYSVARTAISQAISMLGEYYNACIVTEENDRLKHEQEVIRRARKDALREYRNFYYRNFEEDYAAAVPAAAEENDRLKRDDEIRDRAYDRAWYDALQHYMRDFEAAVTAAAEKRAEELTAERQMQRAAIEVPHV